jgi:phosphohistidine phosphatase
MHRLILLRHAKSAYPMGVPDHDRPLNDRGRDNAATIAARLRPFLNFDANTAVAVSTATRAQQTWMITNQGLGLDHWSDRRLYLAEPSSLLEVASAMGADVGVIVGHNPGLEELARSAHGAEAATDPVTQRSLSEKFPTSSFAVLESGTGNWISGELSCTGFAVCR